MNLKHDCIYIHRLICDVRLAY